MRPRGFYAVYQDGQVVAICHGYDHARRVNGGRRHYTRFRSLLAAQEFAAWWNYQQAKSTTARTALSRQSPS